MYNYSHISSRDRRFAMGVTATFATSLVCDRICCARPGLSRFGRGVVGASESPWTVLVREIRIVANGLTLCLLSVAGLLQHSVKQRQQQQLNRQKSMGEMMIRTSRGVVSS